MQSEPQRAKHRFKESWRSPDNEHSQSIRPNELFESMSDDSIKYFYYDEHLNSNGNEYFTASIFPAIAEFYEKD